MFMLVNKYIRVRTRHFYSDCRSHEDCVSREYAIAIYVPGIIALYRFEFRDSYRCYEWLVPILAPEPGPQCLH